MTLGEQIVELTIREVIGRAQKPTTKRILSRCLSSLRQVVDGCASEDAGKMALPAVYGRHVIFTCPNRGMVCDMLRWADPIAEFQSDNPDERAGMWASMAAFINKSSSEAALVALATRLGHQGISEFDTTFARLDQIGSEVVFEEEGSQTSLTMRGSLIVMAGVEHGTATGIIGALPLPVLTKPGPVADWHQVDWSADGNHRRVH